jgi:tRNA threonylcarbamoyladenosine biosynthesis protein TsaE
MKKIILALLISMCLTTIFSIKTWSHPHSWVEVKTILNFENKKLISIRNTFTFDEMNSMFILDEADSNGNGIIDSNEIPVYKKAVDRFFIENLKNNYYFTRFKVNGKIFALNSPKNIKAIYEDQKLSISFSLLLQQPLDPTTSKIGINFYDEEYYNDLYFSEITPISVTGTVPSDCRYSAGEDTDYTFYYNSVNPISVLISCKGP